MAIYYVGPGGNDGNAGTSWATRKLTLNGVEDVPVVAGDVCYVGPGVYREVLTVDVSGGVGTPITYIGDVTGEHTDGVGGVVRITASDDDQSSVRDAAISADGKDYRTFRGFRMDSGTHAANLGAVDIHNCEDWIIEDCVFSDVCRAVCCTGPDQANITVRHCVSVAHKENFVYFYHSSDVTGANHLVENCLAVGVSGSAGMVGGVRVGDITVTNCSLCGGYRGIYATTTGAGQTINVNNCVIASFIYALNGDALGDITEDYNTLIHNTTDRTNTAVGTHSVSYIWLPELPILYAGASQASGFKFPWWFGELSEWSQVRAITGSSEPSVDLLGIGRPATASKCSWGAVQYQGVARETTVVPTGADESVKLADAARLQVMRRFEPGGTLNVRVKVYREANYAGTAPQMVIKQPGQADVTVTDSGSASQWNTLSKTFTPASEPEFFVVELVSNNTATSGSYGVYFQGLSVS